jgi:hypothetical protein
MTEKAVDHRKPFSGALCERNQFSAGGGEIN